MDGAKGGLENHDSQLVRTLALCLLARVEVGSSWGSSPSPISLQSHFRKHICVRSGGNLLKIYTDPNCKVSNGRCKAKCNGATTNDAQTRFTIENTRGRKCIQYTDKQDGSKYALKVINGTNITFEKRQCDNTIGDDFLFDEEKVKGTLALCLLARVEVGSSWGSPPSPISLQSHFRKHICVRSGGNLLKIYTDLNCKVPNGRCKAKCNGATTNDAQTRFTIENTRGRKCIQYTDKQDGSKYALKVVNGTNVTFEKRQCDSTIGDDFLFDEEKVKGVYKYKHTVISKTMCLGVAINCDDESFYLINANSKHRRCSFKRR
ncbi:hypothetical protein OS493_002151 [Desmophyllum pertusum]|uniref:Uncharacterized protein n=1 Tax=Desmophyllum pertusum TaxID=174260 RepID=A0A9X0CTU5_9CNID|nr:hypothetical protein OS493_002151 [Desmophyllum pertusum]